MLGRIKRKSKGDFRRMKINFKDSDNSKLFVTGCPHLNHNPSWDTPIYKMRGYDSAQEMTDSIIENINERCRESDNLLVLGDFCLNTSWTEFQELIWKIKPKIWMLHGNHNSPWGKEFENYCLNEYGFKLCVPHDNWLGKVNVLGYYVELNWNKKFMVCNHYAYQIWNKSHHKSWSLVSHSHGTLPTILPEYKNGKQLDCGWDVHGNPLDFNEISVIMNKKEVYNPDHHDEKTT